MQATRALGFFLGLVLALALARDGFAGPATTTTTTNTTTTSQFPPPCIGEVEVDPDDTVASLTPGVLSAIPIRVTITSGIMDLVPNDGGAGGSFTGQCSGVPIGGAGQPFTIACNYTPSASPPAQITIQANLTPHSGGGTACGPGSTADSDSKTFPVTTPSTTSTTSSSTSTTTTTSSSTTTTLPSTTTTTSTSSTTTIPEGPVAVCHKGRSTLLVDASALRGHLGHGDREGPCPAD